MQALGKGGGSGIEERARRNKGIEIVMLNA